MNLRFKGSYSLERLNTVRLLRKPGKHPAPTVRREFARAFGSTQSLAESAKAGTCVPASHGECSLKTEQIGRIAYNEADA